LSCKYVSKLDGSYDVSEPETGSPSYHPKTTAVFVELNFSSPKTEENFSTIFRYSLAALSLREYSPSL
jgi:hypothetical protein